MGYIGVSGAPLILMLGDSITEIASDPRRQGFQAQLMADYVRKADVVNRGISAWTTTKWLRVLPDLIAEWKNKQPMLVVIFLGANDASLPDGPSHASYASIADYKANLRRLIASFSDAYPQCKYLLLTPPPVDNRAWSPADKLDAVTAMYAAACMDVAGELQIPAIDFYSAMHGQWDLFGDGLHFNAKGMVRAHEMITSAIKHAYPHMTPDALPYEFQI
ncbi:hypothetical protein SDRG_10103 [Saprolegnia diclina VS20]|uniref:SGNH hydrolase-type esterase domain-containing protein n=1 Tax=Saprolegnia diclina (strain VS20) TaxID=1156394 RepID=T0QCC5_SAPDV|nr:hypothetical protein SDRG_10103 [Saprolegnia diclina VS20]EQC32356.1 hypothetical protein SDRG_10103 [Saprolegnia diclina VS20]|eukprot:XP_008614297.1 hypothetical protein SDRG_10103 [Saprolegnia diclina VS20]